MRSVTTLINIRQDSTVQSEDIKGTEVVGSFAIHRDYSQVSYNYVLIADCIGELRRC
jgi:hypothetical protein